MLRTLRALLALGILTSSLASQMRHGLNVPLHGPSSRSIVFGDAFLRAREVTATGTRLFSDVSIPPGLWTVTWEGAGAVHLDGQVTAVDNRQGRARYLIDRNDKALFVRWTGEVTNLHVWMPGHEGKLFWTPFVQLVKGMKPKVLRTLDWTRTNEGLRPRDPRTQWVVSPENQVAFVNAAKCGLHYPIPVNMTEGALVLLFKALREVKGELILEVGNELWNSDFIAWKWLNDQGGRHVDAAAREIDRVFTIARRELPAAKLYVGGHTGNSWYLQELLKLLVIRPDAAGCATYIGPKGVTPDTEAGCIQACRDRLKEIKPLLLEHRDICLREGVSFVAYEGGSAFKAGGGVVAAASRSEEMGRVYDELALVLEQSGVTLIEHYNLMTSFEATNAGPWGLTDSMLGPHPPKFKTVARLMSR